MKTRNGKDMFSIKVPDILLPQFQLLMELVRLRKRGEDVEEVMRQACGPKEAKWMTTPKARESEPATVGGCAEESLSQDGVEKQ